MRAIVAKAAVVAAATGGLAASFLAPLGLERPQATAEALRMPEASHETTVSVFLPRAGRSRAPGLWSGPSPGLPGDP